MPLPAGSKDLLSSLYLLVILCLFASTPDAFSQSNPKRPARNVREFRSTFQLSLFPGISTNGMESGSFYNAYSLNLFGGLSRGNRIFELSPTFNATIRSSSGIQFAALANIVGANPFLNLTEAEERVTRQEDYESNSKGIQFAGLLNFVRTNTSGIEIAGALNVVGQDVKGFQLAGIGNSAGGFAQAIQLAGFYNIAKESVAGVQITSLFNFTDGGLSGTQIALINKARVMVGRKTDPPSAARSLQIGLANFSKETDGIQIGLINFGGEVLGKQIGLINFFSRRAPQGKVRNGTPIGLLNFGSKGSYVRVYASEVFLTNLEYSTGNCLNCSRIFDSEMPFDDSNQIFNQNALIVGYDPIFKTWGFGYGFQKVLFNKVTTEGSKLNKTRIITYGVKFLHLNKDLSFDRSFNLVNKFNLDYGFKLGHGKRQKYSYVYTGISFNYFLHEESDPVEAFNVRSVTSSAGKLLGYSTDIWPGYQIGLHF